MQCRILWASNLFQSDFLWREPSLEFAHQWSRTNFGTSFLPQITLLSKDLQQFFHLCKDAFEHGYLECISSWVKFQFFGAHFTSKSRMATKFSAFDRCTLPTCEKNLQYACRPSKNFFRKSKSWSMWKIVEILTWI